MPTEFKSPRKVFAAAYLIAALACPAAVQAQAPIPGTASLSGLTPQNSTAPVPGQEESRPSSGRLNISGSNQEESPAQMPAHSIYKQLPFTLEDAKTKLQELNNLLEVASPTQVDQIKNNVYAVSEWLQDVADAHWKLYKAFDKSPATKLKAKAEKETALAFSHLKNKAKLLKADLFIKQKRYPEALQPLVEIVVAEPTSETGTAAYKRLTDLGFSPKQDNLEIAAGESPPASGK